jgi:hypothetical protein
MGCCSSRSSTSRVASLAPDAPHEADEPIVRQLEDEIKTLREDLQGGVEELQSSNQELRVANEEVMSVNEELRSSNEELETSKEELQSLNEELTTVNAELKEKVIQLEQAHNDLDNLLTSTNIATIILDTRFQVAGSPRDGCSLCFRLKAERSASPNAAATPISARRRRCSPPEPITRRSRMEMVAGSSGRWRPIAPTPAASKAW